MELLSVVIVLLIYLNASAIYYAVVSGMFSKTQLIFQSLFVVLVPVLGAIFVLFFSISQIDRSGFKPAQDKPKIRLLSYIFLTFLVSQNTSDSFANDSSPTDFGSSDGGGD